MNKLIDVAVLIPCYNESLTIRKVIEDVKLYLPTSHIFVYDNNSTDNTIEIAKNAGASVKSEKRQGKGNVVRSMFLEIDAKCYVMVDGDDTYDLSNIQELVDLVLIEYSDMVVGDRLSSTYYLENKRPFHSMGNRLVKNSINRLFKENIKDIMSGYRAFSYKFAKSFPVISKGFEIETELTIHAIDKNMLISSVVIDYRDRPEGSFSKLNTYVDGSKVIMTIFNLYRNYKPMQFFSFFAIILCIVATIFFIPVMTEFFRTGLVSKIPTLITCMFTYLAGLHSFFAGLILSTIAQKNRVDFELNMHKIVAEYKSIEK